MLAQRSSRYRRLLPAPARSVRHHRVFSPNGMYGRWSAHGLIADFVSVAAMTPFMVLLGSPSPYTGFLAAKLGHVDYSARPGLGKVQQA